MLDFAQLRKKTKRWWQGELEKLPSGYPILRIVPQYRRHWTARALSALVAFYLRHWPWLWGVAIAITLGIWKR